MCLLLLLHSRTHASLNAAPCPRLPPSHTPTCPASCPPPPPHTAALQLTSLELHEPRIRGLPESCTALHGTLRRLALHSWDVRDPARGACLRALTALTSLLISPYLSEDEEWQQVDMTAAVGAVLPALPRVRELEVPDRTACRPPHRPHAHT